MPLLVLGFGSKGTGKSTTFFHFSQQLGLKTIILDPGGASVFRQARLPKIEANDAYRIKEGVWVCVDPNPADAIKTITGFDMETGRVNKTKRFQNGVMMLEDARSYLDGSLGRNLRNAIYQIKQNNVTMMVGYHSIGSTSPIFMELQPDIIFLKKTTDKVFSEIAKAKKFPNYEDTMHAFYRVQCYGLTPESIKKLYGKYFSYIASDLGVNYENDSQFAKLLSRRAHDRINPTEDQRKQAKYYTEFVSQNVMARI